MKVLDAIKDRRAVRAFRDERVSDSVLRELINISINAPSFMNQQPWAYSVVNDPKTISKLALQIRSYLRRKRSHLLPFPPISDRNDPSTADIFYGAPALIVISATTDGYEAEMACAMAAYALMLAATTMGLGVCWVSHADSWFATSEGQEALGIPATYRPVATLVVGAPTAAPVSPGRLDPEVYWVKPAESISGPAAARG
jgi:nitroreductase